MQIHRFQCTSFVISNANSRVRLDWARRIRGISITNQDCFSTQKVLFCCKGLLFRLINGRFFLTRNGIAGLATATKSIVLNAKSIVFNAKSIIFTTKFMTFFYKIFNASSRSGVHTVFSINPHVRDIHYKSWQIMTKKRIGMIVRSIWGMFLRGFARGGFLQWYLPTKCARRRRCLTGSTSPSMAAQLYVLTFKLTILCWNWRFYTNEMMNL